MSNAREVASTLHRLSDLARLHVGRRAEVRYRPAEAWAAVMLDGRQVAAGKPEAVIEAITTKGGNNA